MSQFLQSRGTKTEWAVHQTNFSHVAKNGLGTRLSFMYNTTCTPVSLYCSEGQLEDEVVSEHHHSW